MYDLWSSYGKQKFSLRKKCTDEQQITLTFEQSDRGTIHMFYLHNLPRETEWQCTFNNRTEYGAVGSNTNSPYDRMYKQTAKNALTFEQSNGRTIQTFNLNNSPRETEWQCTFNK